MSNWIKFEKSAWNLGGHAVLFDKIVLYVGRTDHWGISFDVNFYDRSMTFEILNLYAGIEISRKITTD